jgi:hypothetical protein
MMKKISPFLASLLVFGMATVIIGCANPENSNLRFSEEQIASLHLDSTTILQVEIDSIEIVDLNPFLKEQNFDFGSLVKEVKLIPLETTNESLVDGIYKIIVTESHIYIYDRFKGGGLIIFDNEGKFVKRITHGQGPGEINRLYDICYDKDNNELVAYQHSFLYHYTTSGQFIRRERLPFGFYNFTAIPDGYVFKALDRQGNDHLGLLKDYTLFITDKKFKLKSVGMPYPPSDVSYGGYNFLYNSNNAIKITQKFTDTIYQYINETNQFKARYVMDYSKKKLPKRYLQGTEQEFENAISQNDYYYYLGEYFETKSHHVFFLINNYIELNTIIYRDKKSGHLAGGTGVNVITNEMLSIGFPIATSDNYFICTHIPEKMIPYCPLVQLYRMKISRKLKTCRKMKIRCWCFLN